MGYPQGILFDLDGTLYEAGRPILGAVEALRFCDERGLPYRFVTNITSRSREQIGENLAQLGISAPTEWIFTAPAAAREILLSRGITRCHFLLRPSLQEDFPGIESASDSPQALIVGDMGDAISYDSLNRAFRLLLDEGCAFFTLARNRFFKVADGFNIDVGAFVAALEYATHREAELIGKPSPAFFHAAVASMGLSPGETWMIGDDLEGDALGAMDAGLRGILVRTGKFRKETLAASSRVPDVTIDSIAELPSLF